MGISASFYRIEKNIGEKVKKEIEKTNSIDEETQTLIEQNANAYFDLGKIWYDEIAMILSNSDWGKYDKSNIGVQVIYGIGSFEDNKHITIFDTDIITRNLNWLKVNRFGDLPNFEKYYRSLDKEVKEFLGTVSNYDGDPKGYPKYIHLKLLKVIEYYEESYENDMYMVLWIG